MPTVAVRAGAAAAALAVAAATTAAAARAVGAKGGSSGRGGSDNGAAAGPGRQRQWRRQLGPWRQRQWRRQLGPGSGRSGGDDGGGSSGHGGSGDDGGSSGHGGSGDDGGSVGSGRHGSDDGDRGRDRPSARVDLSNRDVESVLRGERVLIDDLGRVLEVEVEVEHGVRTVTVKPHRGDAARIPGPIEKVHAVDAGSSPGRQVVVDQRGEIEVEIEHGVATTKPHGSARTPSNQAAPQAGAYLSPAEEATMIQDGWR